MESLTAQGTEVVKAQVELLRKSASDAKRKLHKYVDTYHSEVLSNVQTPPRPVQSSDYYDNEEAGEPYVTKTRPIYSELYDNLPKGVSPTPGYARHVLQPDTLREMRTPREVGFTSITQTQASLHNPNTRQDRDTPVSVARSAGSRRETPEDIEIRELVELANQHEMLTKSPHDLIEWLVDNTSKQFQQTVLDKNDQTIIKDLIPSISIIDYKVITTKVDKDREIFPDPCSIWKQINDVRTKCTQHQIAYLFYCVEKMPQHKLIPANKQLIQAFMKGTLS